MYKWGEGLGWGMNVDRLCTSKYVWSALQRSSCCCVFTLLKGKAHGGVDTDIFVYSGHLEMIWNKFLFDTFWAVFWGPISRNGDNDGIINDVAWGCVQRERFLIAKMRILLFLCSGVKIGYKIIWWDICDVAFEKIWYIYTQAHKGSNKWVLVWEEGLWILHLWFELLSIRPNSQL